MNGLLKDNINQCDTYPNYFIEDGNENYNTQNVVNKFNEFFVKVGPDLTEGIKNREEKKY